MRRCGIGLGGGTRRVERLQEERGCLSLHHSRMQQRQNLWRLPPTEGGGVTGAKYACTLMLGRWVWGEGRKMGNLLTPQKKIGASLESIFHWQQTPVYQRSPAMIDLHLNQAGRPEIKRWRAQLAITSFVWVVQWLRNQNSVWKNIKQTLCPLITFHV